MAETILSPVAENIIEWISSEAVKEIGLLWGVNEELSGLEDTISTIKAVLLDAERKQGHSNQVRTWLKRLEDVVYEADDLMDEFNTEAMRRQGMLGSEITKQVCTFFSTSNQLSFRHKLGHKIKAIKERLVAIRDDRNFHLEERNEVATTGGRVEATHSYVPEEEVIGRDSDKKAIIDSLFDNKIEENENISVIPIVGSGGLGKTTLAQLVFNDEKIRKSFDLRMWVFVSKDFSVRLIVEKIIRSATNYEGSFENLEMDQLQKKLRKEVLSGKRYLLVLDDVWNENGELWQNLKNLLLDCEKGSKIIVTTRSKMVGEVMSTKPHILGSLSEDDSWTLFKKVALKTGQEPNNSKIVEIGKGIVEICGGVPLAIKTIGRMLYFNNPETEWSSFLKFEFSKIPQRENDILPTLKLSYDDLPSYLKHCFVFCKLFPKGDHINVEWLINLWMALGFIKSSDSTKFLVDEGPEYFMYLLWRSFFQELVEFPCYKFCKMHDLMHDLATQVGGSECAILHSNEKKSFDKHTRHVLFNFHLDSSQRIPTTLSQANKIRTILLGGQSSSIVQENSGQSICDLVISRFKLVRILDLQNLGIKVVPNSIGELLHLRYLDLSRNDAIKVLPHSITMLYNLQTLILSDCEKLRELPRDFKKLVNLVNLEIDGCRSLTHMPCGLDQLTNLQVLSKFVLKEGRSLKSRHNIVEVGKLSDLWGLNNLRGQLEIENLGNGEDTKTANLKEKQNLYNLILRWREDDGDLPLHRKDMDYEATLEDLQPHQNLKHLLLEFYDGISFASWLPSLTNLESLILQKCSKCQYLPPLNQFLSLKELTVYGLYPLEYILADSSTTIVLPSLEKLWLVDLPNLKGWWRREVKDDDHNTVGNQIFVSFPRLSRFMKGGCPKLTFLPLSPNLKEMIVEDNNWQPFQQAMMDLRRPESQQTLFIEETSSPSSSCSFSPFSNLIRLFLWEIEDLECLPEWLKSLTCIEILFIANCPNLKSLSPGIQHLATSLETLRISGCEELDLSMTENHDLMWQALKSLNEVRLEGLPQLKSLPEGLQHVTSLEVLTVTKCKNLIGIPEWIRNLKSLNTLEISECPKLKALPEGVRHLASLKQLNIENCPILLKRCQRDIGEDWPKVAHIPELILRSTSDDSQSAKCLGICKWENFNKFCTTRFCNKGMS